MKRNSLLFLPALILLALSAGCATNECLDNKNSMPVAAFYASGADGQAISISDPVSVYGIDAPAGDSLYVNQSSLSELSLPFRIDENNTTYVISFNISGREVNDTVTFDYDVIPYFESLACGAIYKYPIRGIRTTTNMIDSVVCPANIITNATGSNIKIYLRTAY